MLFLLIPFTSRDADPPYARDADPSFADDGGDLAETMSVGERLSQYGHIDPDMAFNYFGDKYYGTSTKFWGEQEASHRGMLLGHMETHQPDMEFSRKVLERYIREEGLNPGSCADVGCGVGRVSKWLLSDFFKNITLIEPIRKFLAKAEVDVAASGATVRAINVAAQDWQVDDDYDLIWIQWSTQFLTDDSFVSLLKQCSQHLKPNGIVVVKDNMVISEKRSDAVWNPNEHTISRTVPHARELIRQTGLKIDFDEAQADWFDNFIPLYLFVLKN
jgi:protein N-terminal methyltransferase